MDKPPHGFTLLETMLFLVVVSITVAGMFGLFTYALSTVYQPVRLTTALLLARERLEEVLAERTRGFQSLRASYNIFYDEQPIGGDSPLRFADMNRYVQFTKGAITQNNVVQCQAVPVTNVDTIICVTVTVTDSASGALLARTRLVMAQNE